jgi:hypothetical protein
VQNIRPAQLFIACPVAVSDGGAPLDVVKAFQRVEGTALLAVALSAAVGHLHLHASKSRFSFQLSTTWQSSIQLAVAAQGVQAH